MNTYLKAIFATLICCGVIAIGIYLWKGGAPLVSPVTESLGLLERMEKKGVPRLSAKTLDGTPVSLEKQKNKVMIVNFWATWCGPCVEEIPSLSALVESMHGQVEVMAISGDNNQEEIKIFLKAFPKFKNPYIHIVWDEKQEWMKAYGVDRLPESFIVGPNLKLVKKVVGAINWHSEESMDYLKAIIEKPIVQSSDEKNF